MQASKPTILVIDDSEEKRYLLSRYLGAAGFEVWETSSGAEGIALAQRLPSVIALDIKLPDILGYDVSQRLRADPRTSGIPIIQISSTFTTSTSKVRGLNSGADSFLTGPIEPEELIATVRAMMRMRNAELTARDLASKWQATFDAISDAIVLLNAEGVIERCNTAFCQLVSNETEKVVGKKLSEVADSALLDQSVYFQMSGSRKRETVERRVRERWFRITADPVLGEGGSFSGGVLIVSDLTLQKRSEETSRQLAAIVESSDDAIFGTDLGGLIRSWNKSAERLFGYGAGEVVGQHVSVLYEPSLAADLQNCFRRVWRGETTHHLRTRLRCKEARAVDVSLSISPIHDSHGSIVGASSIVRDVTSEVEAERKLAEAHQKAVGASQAKDSFLAALSHELRNPLNPVLLVASESASNPDLPASIRQQFEMIRNNVQLEARLIDDLLDITRISHNKLSVQLRPVEVNELVREALTIVGPDLTLKQIDLSQSLSAGAMMVNGDPTRLKQVFWNVFQNAVKFSPAGAKIDIQTLYSPAQEVVIKVTDSGIGMTERELLRVFEVFSQGDHVKTHGPHRFGGLGLGLAICRRLVELHGGSIQANSSGRDQGSTFVITLPSLPPDTDSRASADQTSSTPPASHSYSIMLVEDHSTTRHALTTLLTRRGHRVRAASTLAEARDLADREAFQLVICDIGLPDGSGYDLMRTLRSHHPSIQGIAFTGYGSEEDVEKTHESGFIMHLTKPIHFQDLEHAIQSLARSP